MSPPTDRRLRGPSDLASVRFDEAGLVPVVAQDADSGAVLMVAWANRHALKKTLDTGFAHFWSRSRNELWRKGESSGNTLAAVSLHLDCDADTVLVLVRPSGPACHTGETTCFGLGAIPQERSPDGGAPASAPRDGDFLRELAEVIRDRNLSRPSGSYTTRLLTDENLRLKKLGEELTELVTALVRREDRAPEEAADLLYHVMVALEAVGTTWAEVERALARRRG